MVMRLLIKSILKDAFLLFNAKMSNLFQLYHEENKLHSMK